MYVCMYVCIYIYIYTYMYMYICICRHVKTVSTLLRVPQAAGTSGRLLELLDEAEEGSGGSTTTSGFIRGAGSLGMNSSLA